MTDKKKVQAAPGWHKEYNLPDEYEHELYLEEQIVSRLKTNLQIASYCNAKYLLNENALRVISTLRLKGSLSF